MKKRLSAAWAGCALVLACAAGPVLAGSALAQATEAKSVAASALGVDIDRASSRVKIDHTPIPSIGMPAMVMTFKVKDPKLLEKVKPGDSVSFEIEQSGLGWIVTRLDRR
jgi:Cu/Ag efflux protein CusF